MRATFESQDLHYNGIERRQKHRRQTIGRRTSIRFEPEKKDRRQIQGRREHDGDSWQQHEF
jgi:hypothetical protein